MNNLNLFTFEGDRPIRIYTGHDGEPRWVAKDVAVALGYSWKGISTIKHVPEIWREIDQVGTVSGEQEVATFTESGLFFFLNRSNKPAALPMQMWISGEVLPALRKTGTYVMPAVESAPRETSLSKTQILIQALQVIDDLERTVATVKADQESLASRVTAIEIGNQSAELAYLDLPPATADVNPLSTRNLVNMTVKGYCQINDHNFQAAYNRLYTEFTYRNHIDLKARAKSQFRSPMDIAEDLGVMEDLYALAKALFCVPSASKAALKEAAKGTPLHFPE